MLANPWFWIVVGYLSGSVLYSALIARFVLRRDLQAVGDGNPGTWNVFRAGGRVWGVVAFLLDYLKGAVPVGLAYLRFGINDWWLVPVALAPVVGHAYPLFAGFRGGKAVAVAAGSWTGITIWEVPTIGGLLLLFWFLSVRSSGWAVVFMQLGLGAYLVLTRASVVWLGVWLAIALLVIWKYRADLTQPPGVGGWVKRVAALWH